MYRVGIKNIVLRKKLDNNPMLCSKCKYNHDMIINKCLGLNHLKEPQKICILLWITYIDKIYTYNVFITFHINVFQHSL